MKKYILACANNDTTSIEITAFDTYDEAYSQMVAEMDAYKNEWDYIEDELMDKKEAFVYNGDVFVYWNIETIEV